MGPEGFGQSAGNRCSSASVSLEPHSQEQTWVWPRAFVTISSDQFRGPNGPGTLGDVAIQIGRLTCKWTIQQVLFKTTVPSPLPPTTLPCLKPFGRRCNGGIGFICLLRQSSSCFNKQLGSRVCLLTTYPYGIPQWTYPVSPPASEANGIWKFPNPNKRMRQRVYFC